MSKRPPPPNPLAPLIVELKGGRWACGDCGTEWQPGAAECPCCGGTQPVQREAFEPWLSKRRLSRLAKSPPRWLRYALGIPLGLLLLWLLLPILWEIFLAILSALLPVFVVVVLIVALVGWFFR